MLEELTEEAQGFLLGRGLPLRLVEGLGTGLWVDDEPGRALVGGLSPVVKGWLATPLRAPDGADLGLEFRRWDGQKAIREWRRPEAAWTPCFLGVWPDYLYRIAEGCDVWLVEGLFDMALSHVVAHPHVVLATGSASVDPDQLRFLDRFLDKSRATVRLAFDMDKAGRDAIRGGYSDRLRRDVEGVLAKMSRLSIPCHEIRFAGGKDPGEVWDRGGKRALTEAFRSYL